jgi:cytochrome b6-f complex iron-sulfur subunit
MALYQKCSHLGCRTPYCPTSGFFECPCHGALFNQAGEVRGGPSPAGLWRFPIAIEDGFLVVDTKRPQAQPPAGVDTTGQQPRAHCLQDVRVDY